VWRPMEIRGWPTDVTDSENEWGGAEWNNPKTCVKRSKPGSLRGV
jgi:hypothetical protein